MVQPVLAGDGASAPSICSSSCLSSASTIVSQIQIKTAGGTFKNDLAVQDGEFSCMHGLVAEVPHTEATPKDLSRIYCPLKL